MPKKLRQTYCNGNLTQLFLEKVNGEKALAIWHLLARHYSHKAIYFHEGRTKTIQAMAKKFGISPNTLNKGLEMLKAEGVVKECAMIPDGCTEPREGIFIMPNWRIENKYGECKAVFMDNEYSYANLKFKIKNLPVYSNIKKQVRAARKKAHIYLIICRIGFAPMADIKRVQKFCRAKGVPFTTNKTVLLHYLSYTEESVLSHKKHAKLVGCKSASTGARHKKRLAKIDKTVKFQRRYSPRIYCSHAAHQKAVSSGGIPPYAKYKNGYSYWDLPTEIVILSPTYYSNRTDKYTNTNIYNKIQTA
jgi:DNA-binding Lrp family transcriptional regulator